MDLKRNDLVVYVVFFRSKIKLMVKVSVFVYLIVIILFIFLENIEFLNCFFFCWFVFRNVFIELKF